MDPSAHPRSVCLFLMLLVVVDPSVHPSVCLCNVPCCCGSVCPPICLCVMLLVVVDRSVHRSVFLCKAPGSGGPVCTPICLSV